MHYTVYLSMVNGNGMQVIVTQVGKLGTLLHARKEEGYGTAPTFNVSIIMGKRDEPLLVACARQLIEHIRFAFYTFVMHFLLVVCRFLLALVELSWIKYLMVSSKDF
jgi:hypothetical protein